MDEPSAPVSLHWQALPARQRSVLGRLGPAVTAEGFYLAGGTAVALHLGHRRSVDLDWFTERPLLDPLDLAGRMRGRDIELEVRQAAPGTLHAAVSGMEISFLEYRYPLLQPLAPVEECACLLASLDDLACMKLAAVVQRGARRDFLDIYAIGTRHCALSEMLSLYQRKYGIQDILHVLRGLSYFDDADRERMPLLLWRFDWRTVKGTIQGWVREMVG